MKQTKLYYEGAALKNMIEYYKRLKHDFMVAYTGYSAMITNETTKEKIICIKESNRQPFELAQKIKREVTKSEIYLDRVVSGSIKYFKIGNIQAGNYNIIHNVDINNAYPSMLFKMGFISKELMDKLAKVDKIKRLKSIGQLATRKTIYVFKQGKAVEVYQKSDEHLRNVWLMLCYQIGEIIEKCRKEIKSFMFYWFDGIYFSDYSEKNKVMAIINSFGIGCKYEKLSNFNVREDARNIYIRYEKSEKGKTKNFCLPKVEKLIYS